jgi:hypothetical protein
MSARLDAYIQRGQMGSLSSRNHDGVFDHHRLPVPGQSFDDDARVVSE